jgi:hypothetical protein
MRQFLPVAGILTLLVPAETSSAQNGAVRGAQFVPQCRGATVPTAPARPTGRSREQLSQAELACFYALHAAERDLLSRAVANLRRLYQGDPRKAKEALLQLHCAGMIEDAALHMFEAGRTQIRPIEERSVGYVGLRKQAAATTQINPRNVLGLRRFALEAARAVHDLQRPLPNLKC